MSLRLTDPVWYRMNCSPVLPLREGRVSTKTSFPLRLESALLPLNQGWLFHVGGRDCSSSIVTIFPLDAFRPPHHRRPPGAGRRFVDGLRSRSNCDLSFPFRSTR